MTPPSRKVSTRSTSDVITSMTSAALAPPSTILLGGVTGELFLRAAGYPVGYDVGDMDLYDEQWTETHEDIEQLLDEYGDSIRLPVDLAYEDDSERAELPIEAIDEKDTAYLDIGSETVTSYHPVITGSAAVFVKGALGMFEDERFSHGTVGMLEAIEQCGCFSVVGGGDTSRAIEMYGLSEDDFSHVSIAGGAYIYALTGRSLPGVEALLENADPAASEAEP